MVAHHQMDVLLGMIFGRDIKMTDTPLYTEEMLPIQCGMMSLIGVMGDAPHSWGNYFSLASGPRILNFWWENLEAADKQFNLLSTVKVRRYKTTEGDWAIIYDDRIPQEWYYNKLCFTGGRYPPLYILKDIYAHLGDPNNEIEQFIDPVSYWSKRNATYNSKNGIITYHVNATSRKLASAWTVEKSDNITFVDENGVEKKIPLD